MTGLTPIVVCDDHPLFRRGVVSCLAADPKWKVVAETSDGEACIAKLEMHRPDILIADLSMPRINGFEVLSWVRKNQPTVRVFVLSMHTDQAYVQKAMDLGAAGFLAKEDAHAELLAALDAPPGHFFTSESIGRPTHQYLPSAQDEGLEQALRKVSEAERRVLVLLTQSLTSPEIAARLNLSTRTVQAHRANLAEKLDATGHNKLLEFAIENRELILRGPNGVS